MGKETKDRILEEALISFVENGYKGTNLRDFAAGMGLSKSALYSHYESKEAIWNALINKMEAYYEARFGSSDHLPEIPQSCDGLLALTMGMVNFTIHDERIIMTRKLLLTEQFHDERVKKLATRHFMDETKSIFKSIFEKMMEKGLLIKEDPDMLAFVYTTPITALIHTCDREPEKESEIIQQVEAFVKHFIRMYGNAGKGCEGGKFLQMKDNEEKSSVKENIEIRQPDGSSFNETSMDSFDRFQEVQNVYRLENGKLVLKRQPFSETWSLERKREKAAEILSGEYIAYCAFAGDTVVGALLLLPELNNGRLIIDSFHVSREYRRRGIGRRLLEAAVEYAKKRGAKALYASCCSAEETIDFYMAMGFRPSEHPIQSYAEAEPFDIQMECDLNECLGRKILVLGCSGSGKSTFARKLQKVTGLPLIHLDNVWWKPDRTHISRDEFDKRLGEIICADQWIIDGDYSRTYETRIAACDTVFFLDFSEEDCLHGIAERVGQKRPDIPWTENTLDPELVTLVRAYHADNRPVLYDLFRKYEKQVIIFKTRAEADEWLRRRGALR